MKPIKITKPIMPATTRRTTIEFDKEPGAPVTFWRLVEVLMEYHILTSSSLQETSSKELISSVEQKIDEDINSSTKHDYMPKEAGAVLTLLIKSLEGNFIFPSELANIMTNYNGKNCINQLNNQR